MGRKNVYEEYCTGCGLCGSVLGASFEERDGFSSVVIGADKELHAFCTGHCPAAGLHTKDCTSPWGDYIEVYRAWATEETVRFRGASGGVTTAVALYLLESGKVDGVIQVGADPEDPFATKVYCNTDRAGVLACTASRYMTSSPLSTLMDYLGKGKTYAFVGRPCDVVVLNNFLATHPEYRPDIYCTLTFFCAGAPSQRASVELARRLGVRKEDCVNIRYRGEGWPGKATVTDTDGTSHTMEYIDSWNRVLGRDVRKMCKFCADGVGEAADISSGDLWYLDQNKKPLFEERAGENVTFARTQKGYEILADAKEKGYLTLLSYDALGTDMPYIQPYHATRKALLGAKVLAMKTAGKNAPRYPRSFLKRCAKALPVKVRMRTYLGTMKRILKKKL